MKLVGGRNQLLSKIQMFFEILRIENEYIEAQNSACQRDIRQNRGFFMNLLFLPTNKTEREKFIFIFPSTVRDGLAFKHNPKLSTLLIMSNLTKNNYRLETDQPMNAPGTKGEQVRKARLAKADVPSLELVS